MNKNIVFVYRHTGCEPRTNRCQADTAFCTGVLISP